MLARLMEYTEEKEVRKVYIQFYPDLLIILPVKNLVLDFYQRELLSDYHKATIDKYRDENDKRKYFLDDVIYRSIQVGEFTQFNEMLIFMEKSGDIAVKFVADKIKKKLSPLSADHSSVSSNGKTIRCRVHIAVSQEFDFCFCRTL